MESPLFDYYPQYIHHPRPLGDWHLYHHNTFLSPDITPPRIKQEEFPTYPHLAQPRNYDALIYPHHSPYQVLLSPPHNEISISQQSRLSTYYSQSMQQQQPTYHPQAYSPATLHATEIHSTPHSSPLTGYADQVGCDPRFVTAHSTLQQDVDLDGMSIAIAPGDTLEDATVGDEDAEGEDEWDELGHQSYHPQYITGGHGEVEIKSEGSTSEEDDDDTEFVLKTRISRKAAVHSPRSATGVHYTSVPIPVPNLTKKSRGRRVPTMSSLEDIRSAASGAGRKRQTMAGKNTRMYLCEVKGCGKCFARGEHLKRHVRSIHTYEKR